MKKSIISPTTLEEVIEELANLRRETARYMPAQIKLIDADYTIKADDPYTDYIVDNSSAAVAVAFCPLAPVKFKIIALGDAHNVTCSPVEAAVTVNGYATDPVINQTMGWWEFLGDMKNTQWKGTTNGYSTIYEVSSETADTGLALDGTWDDVSGMTLLNGIYGKGYLDAFVSQKVEDSSNPGYIEGRMGLGTLSGNNAPNIPEAYNYISRVNAIANTMYGIWFPHHLVEIPYTSDGSTIYMKSFGYSDELNITAHVCYGNTGVPMYIRWRRTA